MIHGRIEDCAGVGIRSLNLDLRQLVVPLLASLGHTAVEVPAWNFLFKIESRVVLAHCRESHFHEQWLIAIGKGELPTR